MHHGSNPIYIDKNFGAMLSVWDRMFGTFEPEVEPVVYGIGDHKLSSVSDMFWGGYRDLGDCVRSAAPGDRLRVLVAPPGASAATSARFVETAGRVSSRAVLARSLR